jgi:hypothetical protein
MGRISLWKMGFGLARIKPGFSAETRPAPAASKRKSYGTAFS